MAVDTEYTAIVRAWEYRLGVLNQMVGSVEPRPIVWENIQRAIGQSGPQVPVALPETATPPVAPVIAEPVRVEDMHWPENHSNVIQLTGRVKRWRNIASFATAAAAALVAMLGLQIYSPDLLPGALRPKIRTQVVEVKSPPLPAPPSAQYVAILQGAGGAPAFILTVDAAISEQLSQPRSLGVIGGGDFTARPVLASYDANTINGATYAVTVEQAGGSPDGKPHSTPVFSGKLIETVPAPPR